MPSNAICEIECCVLMTTAAVHVPQLSRQVLHRLWCICFEPPTHKRLPPAHKRLPPAPTLARRIGSLNAADKYKIQSWKMELQGSCDARYTRLAAMASRHHYVGSALLCGRESALPLAVASNQAGTHSVKPDTLHQTALLQFVC